MKTKWKFVVAGLAAMLGLAGSANAALTIVVPTNFQLQPNMANQPVTLSVSGGDQVSNIDLKAVLGDGTGPNPEPIFQSFNFVINGSIWADTATHPGTQTGGPIPASGGPDAQTSYSLNTQNDSVAANGV